MQFTEKKIALDSISSSGKDKYGQWWKSFSKLYPGNFQPKKFLNQIGRFYRLISPWTIADKRYWHWDWGHAKLNETQTILNQL